MSDAFERTVRPMVRLVIDRLVGQSSGVGRWSLVVVWALVLGVAAALLLGVVRLGSPSVGSLPVEPAGAGTQVQIIATQLQLTDRAHEKPIDGLSTIDAATRDWIDDQVCRRWFWSAAERQARAWRMAQKPGLWNAWDTAFGSAPLNVAWTPLAGVPLTLLILALLAAPLALLLWWLPRVRKAYRRLYVSDHRIDRMRQGGAG